MAVGEIEDLLGELRKRISAVKLLVLVLTAGICALRFAVTQADGCAKTKWRLGSGTKESQKWSWAARERDI